MDFIFWAPKSLLLVNCSHDVKRYLLFRRKAMINLDTILKSKDITLPKVLYSQSYSFSSSNVQM